MSDITEMVFTLVVVPKPDQDPEQVFTDILDAFNLRTNHNAFLEGRCAGGPSGAAGLTGRANRLSQEPPEFIGQVPRRDRSSESGRDPRACWESSWSRRRPSTMASPSSSTSMTSCWFRGGSS